LRRGGFEVARFSSIEPDPSIETANLCAKAAKECRADLLVGLGGGSAMDIAKVAAALATTEETVHSLFGINQIKHPGLPLILVPTTAGTGSEVTHIAILSDHQEKLKKGIVSRHLLAQTSILDPDLTLAVPKPVTAASGMDAMLHAVEAYTSLHASNLSDLFASQAIQLIGGNLRLAYTSSHNLEARSAMLKGSMLAGIAFASAGVTAVHAFAYPIGAEFHIPHGVANSIMMNPVLKFNMVAAEERFADIARLLDVETKGHSQKQSAEATIKKLAALAQDLEIPRHLSQFGIATQHIPELAEGVLKVTRLLANNRRPITFDDAVRLYTEAL
jgi:alcohol dehydrogenase